MNMTEDHQPKDQQQQQQQKQQQQKQQQSDQEVGTSKDDDVVTALASTSTSATQNAKSTADELNLSLLQSDHERQLHSLQQNLDVTNQTCQQQQTTISELQAQISKFSSDIVEKDEWIRIEKDKVSKEKERADTAVEHENDANERMARIQVEGDSLRQEISRLSTTNASLTAQLSELTSKSTLSNSSSSTLTYENTRLKSELEALNAHTKFLEEELANRTNQSSTMKTQHAKTIHELRQTLHDTQAAMEENASALSFMKLKSNHVQQQLESNQRMMLDKEKDYLDNIHELRIEIQSERNLVRLKHENVQRMEERYNDAVREMESMSALANAAGKNQEQDMLELKSEFQNELQLALQEKEREHMLELEDAQKRMEDVIFEKVKLEDMLMSSGAHTTLALEDGGMNTRLQLLEDDTIDGGGKPLTLSRLYDKLAEKDDELRREKTERRKVELYLERTQQDFDKAAPIMRQKEREYQNAMSQMQSMQDRIQEAVQEKELTLNELHQYQKERRHVQAECQELKVENNELAKQVQSLLQKSMSGNSDLAMEVQTQNQQLLNQHHSMSVKLNELEEKLASDTTQMELSDANASLEKLEEERENQATLVKGIVQQRDLYRALLAKNDTAILAASGGDQNSSNTAIVAAKDQFEKYTEVESKNKELTYMVAKLNGDLISAGNTREGLEERLTRLDTYSAELYQNNNKLQNDLLEAHAATARSNAEASFQQQKVTRLEESQESLKNDIGRIEANKKELQRLNGELQTMIAQHETNRVKSEEFLRQSEVQLRLSETKVQSLQATETRLNAENNSLRSELARHSALQESMLKLESGISAQSKGERDRLTNDLERLTNELSSIKSQQKLEKEKLSNELSTATMKIEEANKNHHAALQETIIAKNNLLTSQTEVKELKDKCQDLEKALNAAKIKLGDTEIDLTEQNKITSLSLEVEKLQNELEAANKKVTDYQKMTKASEAALSDSTNASIAYKEKTSSEINKMKEDLVMSQRSLNERQDALEGITADLSKIRGEHDIVVGDLKAKVDSLKVELDTTKNDRDTCKSQVAELMKEMQVHQAGIKVSKDNYERELALHAEARKELQSVRELVDKEARLHEAAETRIENMNSEIKAQEQAFEETKQQSEENISNLERQLKDSSAQNKILHDQLAVMGKRIDTIQESKMDSVSQGEVSGNDDETSEQVTTLNKQLSDLREVINYMRSERDINETQLQSARLAVDRERSSGEMTKKALDEARVELEKLQVAVSSNEKNDLFIETKTKLKNAEEQLILLRDSNKFLREESDSLEGKVKSLQAELTNAQSALKPSDEKCRELEVDKMALEAEKASILREVDVWKQRVTSLVSTYHQIDPVEHNNALVQVKELNKKCAQLNTTKESVGTQLKSAKAMIVKLNKDLSKMKAVESSLEEAKKEVESLKSSKSVSAVLEKKIDKMRQENTNSSSELDATKKRVENLSEILKKHKKSRADLQTKFNQTSLKEREANAALEREKLCHQNLLKTYESLQKQMKEISREAPQERETNQSDPVPQPKAGSSQQDNGNTSTKSGHDSSSINIPTMPKVPTTGFSFGPSDSKIVNKNEENDNEKLETSKDSSSDVKMASVEKKGNDLKAQDKTVVSAKSLLNKPQLEQEKEKGKVAGTDPISGDATQQQTPASTGNDEQGGKKRTNVTVTIPTAPPNKSGTKISSKPVPEMKAPAGTKTEENITREKLIIRKRDAEITNPTVPPNKSETKSVLKPAPETNTPTAAKNEESTMREKLMKRKRDAAVVIPTATPQKSESIKPPAPETTTPTGAKTGENSLREKLMKRKRELAKKIEAKNASKKIALSSVADTPIAISAQTNEGSTEPNPTKGDAANLTEKNVSGTEKEEQQILKTETTQTKSDIVHDDIKDANTEPSVVDIAKDTPKDDQQMAEVQQTTNKATFGMPSTLPATPHSIFGNPMNPDAKPYTPTFGVFGGKKAGEKKDVTMDQNSTKKETSESTSGAFLDLKPPGSGQSTNLFFGSSTKIQLPTPSKNTAQSAKLIFGSSANIQLPTPSQNTAFTAAFGSFGSSTSTPVGTSIFGSSLQTKKRPLEISNSSMEIESSTKMNKVESGNESKDEKSEVQEAEKNTESSNNIPAE